MGLVFYGLSANSASSDTDRFVCLFELMRYVPVMSGRCFIFLDFYPKFGRHDIKKVLQI